MTGKIVLNNEAVQVEYEINVEKLPGERRETSGRFAVPSVCPKGILSAITQLSSANLILEDGNTVYRVEFTNYSSEGICSFVACFLKGHQLSL